MLLAGNLNKFRIVIWRFEKHILSEKNPPLVSCQSLGDYFKSEQVHNGVKVYIDLFYNNFLYYFYLSKTVRVEVVFVNKIENL